MSEKIRHIESDSPEHEATQNSEIQPESTEKIQESKNETLSIEQTRERVREIQNSTTGSSQKSHQEDASVSGAFLPRLESATETLAKTLGKIRRNLTPSEKSFSKVMHNPIVNAVTEATAKTLARPYAILSGGIVACIGSAIYMYYTRHLGYRYNFFVPILLFLAGLAAGIAVEVLYKALHRRRKRKS